MLVILCDGSSKGNPGPSRIGVVIWKRLPGTSSARKVKPDISISKDIGIATNNDAEWQAVLEALKYANSIKYKGSIFIYTDSLLVANQARGLWKIKNDKMREYQEKANELCINLDDNNIQISWLPRQLTQLADNLT